jgi:hypothetical protein
MANVAVKAGFIAVIVGLWCIPTYWAIASIRRIVGTGAAKTTRTCGAAVVASGPASVPRTAQHLARADHQ